MAPAARVVVWAARGNRTVDVRRLRGPRHGQFVPAPYLAQVTGSAPPAGYDMADRSQRDAAYTLLLCQGTAEDITGWVNADLLAACLDDLDLAPHVAGPWRRALRDLGLLPAEDASDEASDEAPDEAPEEPADQPADATGPDRDARDAGAGDRNGAGDLGASGGRRPAVRPGGPHAGDRDGTDGHRPTVPAA